METINKIKQIGSSRLRAARKLRFKSAREAADFFGWSKDTYTSHEGGRRRMDEAAAAKYAEAFGVNVSHLLAHDIIDDTKFQSEIIEGGVKVAEIPVYGQLAGGVWLEGEISLENAEAGIFIPASTKARPEHQYARRVIGNSVSNRIPDGFYAIFIHREFFPGPIPYGSLVDVHRTRGGLHEYSIKAYWGDHLSSDSRELDKQVNLALDNGEEDTIVIIEGIAIGAYQDI
jgi:hypothetical protein